MCSLRLLQICKKFAMSMSTSSVSNFSEKIGLDIMELKRRNTYLVPNQNQESWMDIFRVVNQRF